jgi:hypothetical protein
MEHTSQGHKPPTIMITYFSTLIFGSKHKTFPKTLHKSKGARGATNNCKTKHLRGKKSIALSSVSLLLTSSQSGISPKSLFPKSKSDLHVK